MSGLPQAIKAISSSSTLRRDAAAAGVHCRHAHRWQAAALAALPPAPPARVWLPRAAAFADAPSRRAALAVVLLSGALQLASRLPAAAAAVARPPRLPPELRAIWEQCLEYWGQCVQLVQRQVGADFSANLLLYTSSSVELPSGVPGDPARDYRRRAGAPACAPYTPDTRPGHPYPFCAPPGDASASAEETECCRHFAFAVPYSRLALARADRQTAVVVSPRLLRLPPQRWRAVLAHELGHCVDFWLFGDRYRLPRHLDDAPVEPQLRAALAAIDAGEGDPEIRADLLGELLILQPLGSKLCYDTTLRLQLEVEPLARCEASGETGGGGLMRHYTHPPLAGAGLLRPDGQLR